MLNMQSFKLGWGKETITPDTLTKKKKKKKKKKKQGKKPDKNKNVPPIISGF